MQYKELRAIVISALVLALAFGIALSGGISAIFSPDTLLFATLASLIAVSTGFVLHELGHRFMAKRYHCRAEYQMWQGGLIVALALSLFGFVFAAPGAVMIYPRVNLWGHATALSKKAYGLISLTGPLMNMLLAGIFFILNFIYPSQIFQMGSSINIWMALFNLIPFPPFDGIKIFAWDARVWLAALIVAAVMFVL